MNMLVGCVAPIILFLMIIHSILVHFGPEKRK